jgi:predicted NAD/FAD-binding protein
MAVWDRARGLAFRRADLRTKVPPELSSRFGVDSERFLSRAARRIEADADSTLEEFLQREGYDADAVRYTIIPPIANLWGFDWRTTMSLSARYAMQEIDRLRLSNRAFRAGTGGVEHIARSTRAYLDRLTAAVDAEIVTRAEVLRVERDGDRVLVVTAAGSERFDAAVLAVHGDHARRLLHRPTELEERCLSAFTYHHVPAIVHTDTGMLPPDPSLWEHFNYTHHAAAPPVPATSWYLNMIYGFAGRPHFLTVGEVLDSVSREAVVETVHFRHPVMTPAAVAATKHVAELNATGPIYFCGSYTGDGSHEAAIASAKLVSERLIPYTGTPLSCVWIAAMRRSPVRSGAIGSSMTRAISGEATRGAAPGRRTPKNG